jgi:chromatin remodeling complex protein RSC6
MKQTSEKFAEMMLENETAGQPVSFAEQIAKVEQQMTERINDMTDKILASVAESQRVQSTELEEITNDTDVSRETLENENEENESEE